MSFIGKKVVPSNGNRVTASYGLARVLKAAAEDMEKSRAPHRLSVTFGRAQQLRLADKLAGRNSDDFTFEEKRYLAEALSAVSQERDVFKEAAFTDPLTGLLNKKGFAEAMETEFSRLEEFRGRKRMSTAELGLLYIDLDGFKAVNDTFGHAIGDKVLVEFTSRMKTTFRKTDSLARIGGDEFCFLLPYDTNDEPKPTYEMIRSRVDEALEGLMLFDADNNPFPVGASLGFTTSQDDLSHIEAESIAEAMMEAGDRAMYLDKYGHDREAHGSTYPKNIRLEAIRQKALEQFEAAPSEVLDFDGN